LEIKQGIQSDGRNRFLIEKLADDDFVLWMSPDNNSFFKKYRFSLLEVPVEKFSAICLDKQTNSPSYFVKNTICTRPTSSGRLTLLNDKLIEKKDNYRKGTPICNDEELRLVLKNSFGIVVR